MDALKIGKRLAKLRGEKSQDIVSKAISSALGVAICLNEKVKLG